MTHALKSGYKLVDCAYCYGNEDEVGAGLAAAFAEGAAKREDVFVVSKVWATYNSRVEEGLDKSLKSLGLDYVDLYLVHWPALANPEGEFLPFSPFPSLLLCLCEGVLTRLGKGNHDKFPTKEDGTRDMIASWNHVDTWKQMEALVAKGKVKAIGVCNVRQLQSPSYSHNAPTTKPLWPQPLTIDGRYSTAKSTSTSSSRRPRSPRP